MREKRDERIVDLGDQFWTNKYENNQVGWDVGYVSTPLKTYFDQIESRDLRILIPGAGNAYEAEYLWNNDFKNVYVADVSELPLANLKNRVPSFPQSQLLHMDFFQLEGEFDLIVEQTFFCALDPQFRTNYVKKMKSLIASGGRLVGLMFNIPLNTDRPPFGGNESDYRNLFSNDFEIDVMETAHNSIPQRAGNELFVKMRPQKLKV